MFRPWKKLSDQFLKNTGSVGVLRSGTSTAQDNFVKYFGIL